MGKALDEWLRIEVGFDLQALDADTTLMEWADAKQIAARKHRESSIEAAGVNYAVERGWMHKKIGTNAWPDHLFLGGPLTMNDTHDRVVFVEFKQRNKPPRANQAKRLRELQNRGFTAVVCDRKEQFVDIFGA